jgi:hypothetical protein
MTHECTYKTADGSGIETGSEVRADNQYDAAADDLGAEVWTVDRIHPEADGPDMVRVTRTATAWVSSDALVRVDR